MLGTALVAADPVHWGRLAGIAVLLAGVGLMGVEMILVNLLQHRERKQADALEAAQTQLDEATGLEAVLEQGVLAMVELLEAQAGMAVVREREDADFEFVTAWGFGRDVLDGRTGDLVGAEVLATLVRGRRPVYVDLTEERFAGSSLRLTGMRWLWVGPFRAGRMDGLIMAASMTGRPARHVGAVLGGPVRDRGSLGGERSNDYPRTWSGPVDDNLADFGNFAVSSFEEEHLRKAATAALQSMFPQGAGYITALDPGSGALKVAEVFGSDIERTEMGGLLGRTECDSADGCRAISWGGAYEGVGNGGLWDCPYRRSGEGAGTFACAPIVSSDGPLGALHVTRPSGEEFEADEKEILEALGIQLGLAIANSQLLAVTRDQALRDSMTGLHNYRYLVEFLNNQAALIRRTHTQVSVLMIDIDHFRKFNNPGTRRGITSCGPWHGNSGRESAKATWRPATAGRSSLSCCRGRRRRGRNSWRRRSAGT